MASALISAPTTALAQSLLSSNSSVHVNDSFDTATPFVDEVLEAGLILLKKVKVFVGTQLVHEYEGAYDAIYDELEQDRSVPHTVNLINECWATQVLLRRSQRAQLRGSGNDLKIQITYASHKDVTATWVTTGIHTDSGLTATTDLDSKLVLRYTHVSPYELSLHPTASRVQLLEVPPLSKIDLKCDNIKALDSSIHDAHFLRTAIANREHRNVPTRKYLELLQGFADNTDANGAKALAEAADTTYGTNEVSIINALRNALHPHPWSGNDTAITTLTPRITTTATSCQRRHEDVRRPRLRRLQDDRAHAHHGGDADDAIADIYCRYYNEISFINGGAYRRFH
eukprot:tig00000248_g21841.t1